MARPSTSPVSTGSIRASMTPSDESGFCDGDVYSRICALVSPDSGANANIITTARAKASIARSDGLRIMISSPPSTRTDVSEALQRHPRLIRAANLNLYARKPRIALIHRNEIPQAWSSQSSVPDGKGLAAGQYGSSWKHAVLSATRIIAIIQMPVSGLVRAVSVARCMACSGGSAEAASGHTR